MMGGDLWIVSGGLLIRGDSLFVFRGKHERRITNHEARQSPVRSLREMFSIDDVSVRSQVGDAFGKSVNTWT